MSGQVRDRLAEKAGWHFAMDREIGPLCWVDPEGRSTTVDHPYPNDLNGAARAWSDLCKRWEWARWGDGVWIGQNKADTKRMVEVIDTGNEVQDRFALAWACVEASKGESGNG